MIRHATEGDIIQLKTLWDQSFEDPLSYIDFIYEKVARPADTLVYDIGGGTVVSMMTLIPMHFVFQSKAVRTMYIYGAATDKKYQKQGFMAALLKYAEDYAKNLDFKLSVLVPGEKHLFDYYRRRGYSADFNCRVLKVRPGMISQEIIPDADVQVDTVAPEHFYKMRKDALAEIPHIEWNVRQIGFVFEDLRLYGEHIAHYEGRYGESYAVYGMAKKNMYIKECFGTSNDARLAAIKDIIQKNDPKDVRIQLHVNSKLFDEEGKLVKYGMAKPLTVNASIKDMDPYMNLMMD